MLEAGSAATCGICGKETTVHFVTERVGGTAYDLTCFHRNAVCPNCGALVRDDSDRIDTIVPLCRTCNPEAFVDDDE